MSGGPRGPRLAPWDDGLGRDWRTSDGRRLARACWLDDEAEVHRILTSGRIRPGELNTTYAVTGRKHGTPLVLAGLASIARMLMKHGAVVNDVCMHYREGWVEGFLADRPDFDLITAYDSALRHLENARRNGDEKRIDQAEELLEALARAGGRRFRDLSAAEQAALLNDSRLRSIGRGDFDPSEQQSPKTAQPPVQASRPRTQPNIDDRIQTVEDAVRVGREDLAGIPTGWDWIKAALSRRYHATEDELALAWTITSRKAGARPILWLINGVIGLRELAMAESLGVYYCLARAMDVDVAVGLSDALRKLELAESLWDLAGFHDRSYNGPDGGNLAVALLELPHWVLNEAGVPGWMTTGEEPMASVEVALSVVEATRGHWMNFRLLTGHPLPTSLAKYRERWNAVIRQITADHKNSSATAELRTLLGEIRMEPGEERFGKTPHVRELLGSVPDGHAVVVLIHPESGLPWGWRAWALVVVDGTVSALPLPREVNSESLSLARTLLNESTTVPEVESDDLSRWMMTGLEWLFQMVVAPVLSTIPESVDSICWVPTGEFVGLPLHVEGPWIDSQDVQEDSTAVADRQKQRSMWLDSSCRFERHEVEEAWTALWTVVEKTRQDSRSVSFSRFRSSCHSSSLTALALAEKSSTDASASRGTTKLVVACPQSPGTERLMGVELEAESVAKRLGGSSPLLSPKVADLLHKQRGAQTLHFAGHATRDGLCCEDGTLTIRQIALAADSERDLAFLSACETHVPSAQDPDVTVAGAMQIAGFPNVVATLAPVADDAALEVAMGFYKRMRANPSVTPAVALAATLTEIRRKNPTEPWCWTHWIVTSSRLGSVSTSPGRSASADP